MEIVIIIVIVWLAFAAFGGGARRNKENDDEYLGRDDASQQQPLTEVQKQWREQRQRELLEKYNHDVIEEQKLIKEMQEFVAKNQRSFNFYEWLHWQVEPDFLKMYFVYTSMAAFIFFLPLIVGGVMFILPTAIILIVTDIQAFKRRLFLEATEWNPEWHKKFRNRLRMNGMRD